MNSAVLDASAILAVINAEPGYEKLGPTLLANAVASAVNIAEVHGKLISRGWPADEAWEDASGTVREVLAFGEEHARLTGSLIAQTRSLGLSLGDRACLALGMLLKAPVYTAEKSWQRLKLDVRIHSIR